ARRCDGARRGGRASRPPACDRSRGRRCSRRHRRARRSRRRTRRHAQGRARGRHAGENPCGDPVRVVIADDELLLREGLERLLTEAGYDVVGKVGTAEELRRKVELTRPDVAIVDIKMPPTYTDEGLVGAQDIRDSHPEIGVLVLSHYLESRYAMRLIEQHPGGTGYLLKERISDLAVLTDSLGRLRDGECVVDP